MLCSLGAEGKQHLPRRGSREGCRVRRGSPGPAEHAGPGTAAQELRPGPHLLFPVCPEVHTSARVLRRRRPPPHAWPRLQRAMPHGIFRARERALGVCRSPDLLRLLLGLHGQSIGAPATGQGCALDLGTFGSRGCQVCSRPPCGSPIDQVSPPGPPWAGSPSSA